MTIKQAIAMNCIYRPSISLHSIKDGEMLDIVYEEFGDEWRMQISTKRIFRYACNALSQGVGNYHSSHTGERNSMFHLITWCIS